MKQIIGVFFTILVIVAVAAGFPSPALAAGTIEITDSAAIVQSLDMIFQEVGAGDELVETVGIINSTANTHAVYLKSVEILNDSKLLDEMTFSFLGDNGKQLTLTKENFNTVAGAELCRVNQHTSGSFTIQVKVGNITNEHQALSCSIRYNFEIINLNYALLGDSPRTGDRFLVLPAFLAICASIVMISMIVVNAKKRTRP